MTNVLSEKDYQKFLLERLSQDNGYVIRKAANFDRRFAVDREMLFKFLNDTQPDTMEYLRKIYKDDLEDTIVSFRFLYKGIIIKHNKTEPTYTKTSLFLCEKRRFFMARTEKGVVTTI